MAKKEYAYLHNHTKFSIKDAMPSAKDYVDCIYEYNQASPNYECIGLALTDHGNISVLPSQYDACNNPVDKNKKIHPIFGIEIYHCLDITNNPDNNRFHMVLLAKNDIGMKNIYMISSHGGLNIIKGKSKDFPVTDLKYLKDHGEGVICLTACVAGLVPDRIINGKEDEAKDIIDELCSIFDEVYLEVQPFDFPEQLLVNEALVRIAQEKGLKLVMTCDAHYINASDKKYHDLYKEIVHQGTFQTNNYLRTPEEMEEYCINNNIPVEAITNTAEIAKLCQVDPKPLDHRDLLPTYPCPKEYANDADYLRKLCFDHLKEKIIKKKIEEPSKYIKEMLYELEVICEAGFASYFLILWDWFKWCRDNGILMGPGRGSAAGSIVSYVLDITKVDPIKNEFYFERFLSPERLEFPDVDSDVPRDRRAEAINYLLSKYGQNNVSQIVTFGEYKVKNTIRGVLSKEGCPIGDVNKITKSLPDMIDGKAVTFHLLEDFHNNPDNYSFETVDANTLERAWNTLEDVFKQYPSVYDALTHIGGCYSSVGIHAGGVVVCKYPINEHGQVMLGSETAVLPVLQFEMTDLDFFGFLKIDVLGLKTLDVIKYTMDLVNLDYDWYDSEDFNDPDVYAMLRNGETCDVFQMSNYSPTKMIKDFNVKDIDGLCAVNAGNRPGPLEKDKETGKSMVDLYVDHVKTDSPEDWGNKEVNHVLRKTYGCIWYQENCMELGRVMAGYSMGGSDSRIRKVLGKKKVKMIPEIKNEFIYGKKSLFDEDHNVIGISDEPSDYCEGCLARGYSEELANRVFDNMAAFAKYSFNRSHSFCYAVLAYKTAYLSYHYPVEFAIANCTINDQEKDIIASLSSARKRKIRILSVDINKSQVNFSNDNGAIRYGLKGVKGIGTRVVEFLDDYKSYGPPPFNDFDDFHVRIHDNNDPIISALIQGIRNQTGKSSNNPIKKDVEIAMILSGCFDFSNPNRYELLNHYIQDIRKEQPVEITIVKDENNTNVKYPFPLDPKKYDEKEKLMLEKYYLGTYVSEHPLDKYPYTDLDSTSEGEKVRIGGVITAINKRKTKTGKDFLTIKFKGKDEIERNGNIFLDKLVEELSKTLKKNQIVVISGVYSTVYHNININSLKIQDAVQTTNASQDTVNVDANVTEKENPVLTNVQPVDPIAQFLNM